MGFILGCRLAEASAMFDIWSSDGRLVRSVRVTSVMILALPEPEVNCACLPFESPMKTVRSGEPVRCEINMRGLELTTNA